MSHSHFVFYTRPHQFIHSEIRHLPPLLLPFKPSSFLLAVLPLVGGPEVLILEIFGEFSANLAVGVPGGKKRSNFLSVSFFNQLRPVIVIIAFLCPYPH